MAGGRGANFHYDLMTTKEIMNIPVQKVADDNCHLYLWATNATLPDAMKVIAAWGFKYITCVTWMKDRIGLGQYYRGITEHCLFARKGRPPYKTENGKRVQGVTGFFEKKRKHSEKPEKMREMIEKVSYGPFLELFARARHPGWDVWGNEVEGINLINDIKESEEK